VGGGGVGEGGGVNGVAVFEIEEKAVGSGVGDRGVEGDVGAGAGNSVVGGAVRVDVDVGRVACS